jgi:hypothetical protein
MSGYQSPSAQCPFYLEESLKRDEMVCEGVVERSRIHHKFPSEKLCMKYMEKYCYSNYKDCLICRMLYSKYDT